MMMVIGMPIKSVDRIEWVDEDVEEEEHTTAKVGGPNSDVIRWRLLLPAAAAWTVLWLVQPAHHTDSCLTTHAPLDPHPSHLSNHTGRVSSSLHARGHRSQEGARSEGRRPSTPNTKHPAFSGGGAVACQSSRPASQQQRPSYGAPGQRRGGRGGQCRRCCRRPRRGGAPARGRDALHGELRPRRRARPRRLPPPCCPLRRGGRACRLPRPPGARDADIDVDGIGIAIDTSHGRRSDASARGGGGPAAGGGGGGV